MPPRNLPRTSSLWHKAIFELMRRNPSGAAPHVEVFADLARQHVMPNWLAYGHFFEPWARWHLAGRDGSLTDMRRAIATLREQGVALYTIALETMLAEVEAEEGQLETANATVDRALTETERTGHRWFEAETHRIRGEILLKRDLANTALVEEAFLTAIAVAGGLRVPAKPPGHRRRGDRAFAQCIIDGGEVTSWVKRVGRAVLGMSASPPTSDVWLQHRN